MKEGKIFGIGLHKTGGTSLCAALKKLGYSVHQMPVKALGADVNGNFMLNRRSLERRDVYLDHPIQLLYPQADEYFPGSKFILNYREKDSWLDSTESHFSKIRNFARRHIFGEHVNQYLIHLYGSSTFDDHLFSEAYDRHHEQITQYFEGRQSDLLRIDICGGEGWDSLCDFLGKDLPKIPFPHKNRKEQTTNLIFSDIPVSEKIERILGNLVD